MSSDTAPILLWLRRGDLRLSDNPALAAAARSVQPVIPVFLRDETVDRLGAAPRWRLEQSLAALDARLRQAGSRLILRAGSALETLEALLAETGAGAVYWGRSHEPDAIARDTAIKTTLTTRGIEARSFAGNLLFEPWNTRNASGQPYKVFTPMWRALRSSDVAVPARAPARLPGPEAWPRSDQLAAWKLSHDMGRGAAVLGRYCESGEDAALNHFEEFLDEGLAGYGAGRDRLTPSGTSALSPFLATGEIGVRQCWHGAMQAHEAGNQGAEPFLRQLMWREFSAHLLYHWPELPERCWRSEWGSFPWNSNEDRPEIRAWKRGRTGIELVDAGMREMMVTGQMHNRVRMVVASYLTKHLLGDWRIGLRWFERHLVDWDAANNAASWQWVAGCGADASPFFRVFNPDLQAEKFDPDRGYRNRWLAEGQENPPETALAFFEAAPAAWGLSPDMPCNAPVVGLTEGRAAALSAHSAFRETG